MKRVLSLIIALAMLLGLLPMQALAIENAETVSGTNELSGKTISILGASISTYTGISNNIAHNSTIGNNAVYYTEGRHGVYANDTWWMQVANDLGLCLLVNNSWSGSSLLYERNGTMGAYVDRCVQLHNNEGEMPDIIAIQMGTNDFQYYKDTLGTADIDYAELIVLNEDGSYTYAEPTTSLEAAAIVLHKISIRYPNAEVYYLNISQRVDGTDELICSFNAELKQVVEHFGAHIVDIYGSAITMADFDTYIGDGRVHPNKLGMDAYTEAFKRELLANTAYEVDTHTVSLDLDGVTADYGDNKIVVSGDAFSCELTAEDGKERSVSVIMGGEDITDSAYESGTVSIESVTADVVIAAEATVHKPQNYRWEFDGTDLACVSGGNTLTKDSGTTTDGVFSKTSYTLKNEVVLMHDLPWIVEWKCEGTFLNTNGSSGARIFTSDNVNANYNARYIFKSNTNGIIAMGEKDTKGSHNYGVALADHGIDWTALHTYRLENRIATDGSNMIYLLVDGEEIGPMNHYYIGTKDQNTASDWLSGKDFVFPYMGTDTHGFTNASIEYIQVWEGGHSHTYENGVCTGCGTAASPYLQQLPESIIGCTNLYDSLIPVKGYYTATKYDTSNGAVLSVVIPVEPGDRIAASSFGPVSENMGSVNGIRVTYLRGDKIVTSLSAGDVYNGYTNNGYITVPDGVDAVCIPWWIPSDSNWLTLSQISKDFAVHSPKAIPAQAPTCTENGYTAGEICEICGASLGSREEIPATGHDYSENTCTICGTVNVLAILDGKYVSILGDSISTFNGYSNDATVNTTIGGNGPRYDTGTADTKPGSYCLLESVNDTWWMHFANRSGMKLLVNNSWAGSQVFGGKTSDGRVIPAAYLERCINLHDNTIENNPNNAPINPDVIFVYLGINDYNFNRSNVGNGAVDYAALISSDGTYITPTTFGEAYGILLHKMQQAYTNARIFAMTLLPENLYSVDKAAWEQHNAYIRAAAEYYDIPVVDLAEKCAITWDNYSGYMMDKIHPTTAGMELISDCIEAELVAYYNGNLPHTHSYTPIVTAPTCTEGGYTTYTCECGDSYVADLLDATGHTYENAICIWCAEWNICWEVGTIAAANGANNVNATRIRTLDHLRLSDFAGVCVNVGYQLTWLAYDANKNYIGNGTSSFTGYWQPSGQSIATADIHDLYADAVYFRLALKNISGGNMTLEDAERSGVTFIPFGQALPEPEFEVEYENSTNIGSWQDGAIWNGNLFVLGASGTGVVYDLENLSKLATFSLDSADVLKPHANSVCFGSTYYAPGDEYPLLYVNIYNNYASTEDRMEGTCCAYRISKTDGGFATELVQVIRIGFVEDLSLWKSKENNGDVRPYGNFLVDTDDNKLYAYVMRDASKATRFFKFDLPELTDGIYSETYGCNVVTLESADIEGQFDTEYFKYLQGGTYSSGMILSAEGFNAGSSAEPAIRIIDLQTGTVSATYYMANSGLTTEPEVVCVDPTTGLLYYAPADGILRILSIPDVHFHGYTSCVISPTCTEQGYTTYTCACGDSYVDDVSMDITDRFKWNEGYVISAFNGNMMADKNWVASDYVDISAFESIEIVTGDTVNANTTLGIAFYDANKKFVSGVVHTDKTGTEYGILVHNLEVLQGVSYLRTTWYSVNHGSYNGATLHTFYCKGAGTAIPPLGHDYVLTEETKPNCSAGGTKVYICSRCGESTQETTSKGDHAYDNGICIGCGSSILGNDWIAPNFAEGDYSMVVLPDTQKLVTSWEDTYYEQMQWIADNEDALNIQAVLHMGDMVDNNTAREWTICEAGTDILQNAGIPWMPMRGNHDDADYFNNYYDYTTYGTNQSWFGGAYHSDKLEHTYWFVTVGQREYMILSLGWAPSWDVLAWAQDIVEAHSDKNVILTCHAYMNSDGTLLDSSDAHCPSSYHPGYPDGDDVWDAFKGYENVVLAMGGHIHSANIVTFVDQNGTGRDVTSLLVDRQNDDMANHYGMVAVLTFHNGSNTVDVNWYSVRYDALYRAKNQFSIDVPHVHSHEYVADITVPTCTEVGYTTYTCACGDSYTSDVVAALGHDFSQSFVCSRCDHVAKVSVLGDSISTYAGFSAVKNAVYPNKTIQSVEDTWWKQVVDTMGTQLLVNNASGGSRVLSDEYFNGNCIREGNYAAYRDRCVNLHDGDEKPDVIFVFMGTNDFSYHVDSSCEKCQILLNCSECTAREDGNLNVCSKCRSISGIYSSFCNLPLGIADSVNASAEVPTSVCEAYAIMLSKMKAAYPNAQIYCMGLLPRVNTYQNATYHDHGQPTAFNAELKKVAENAGARFISLEQSVDNSASTWNTYFGDAVHPTAIGMDKISAAVLTDVLGKEIYTVSSQIVSSAVTMTGESWAMDGAAYEASVITLNPDLQLDVRVIMNGVDVTENVFNAQTGRIYIVEVTGNILITVKTEGIFWSIGTINTINGADADDYKNRIRTDYISVNEGVTVRASNDAEINVVYFDANYKILSANNNTGWIKEWTSVGAPTAAAYIRVVARATSGTNLTTEYSQNVTITCGHVHDYIPTVISPTCTEQGYTTYTCECGDSYRTPWLDKTAYEGKTIACVGDSITAGVGVTADQTDYVYLLAQQLGMDYIRLGYSGTTLCTDGSRTCNITRLTESYLQGADIVTIAMGINDFCAAGAGYYELGDINSTDSSTIYGAVRMWCERIAELRKTDSLKNTLFYFVTPVICSWNNSVTSARDWDQSKKNIHGYTLRDLCNAIIEVTELYDVAVIDLNLLSGMYYVDAEDNNTAVFGGDGVHPGETGHSMMANAMAHALLQDDLRDDHVHTFGSWITTTWPSCLAGEQQRVCTICTATESRVTESNVDHSYESVVTAPTCTEQGYTTYTCTLCGDSYVDDYVEATGHTDENGTCATCGEKLWEYGDANGDGVVDGKDVLLLRKYMANYDYDLGIADVEVSAGADANGDGVVNGKDLLLLRRYMANYDFETGKSTIVLGP